MKDFFVLDDVDLIVKFLYVKAKVEQRNYEYYKDLYTKSIIRFFGGINDGKSSMEKFISDFDALIESMQTTGYKDDAPILLSKDGMILNGRHRLAVCQYFGIQATYAVSEDLGHKRFTLDLDFYATVFSQSERETILVDYVNNIETEQYFTVFLWGDSENKWSYIEDTFTEQGCNTVYQNTYTFDNENHFANIIDGIYTYENGVHQNGNIFIKTQELKKNMKFKFLLLQHTGEKTYRTVKEGFPIWMEIENIKFGIRDVLSNHSKRKIFSYLHTSDNLKHTQYLCNFIANQNGYLLKYIKKDNEFISRTNAFLLQFEAFLRNNNASRYDFCFESGIVLQIFGIRKAADLDFICKKSLRETLHNRQKDIDLHDAGRFLSVSGLSDDDIIANKENFFFYKGYKFVTPSLLIKNTSHLSKKKRLDMEELQKLIKNDTPYTPGKLYLLKIRLLLRYYWIRRRVIHVLTAILTTRQKYYIKKFLNLYFGQNYNLDHD